MGFLTARGYRAAKARPASARQLRDELLVPEIVRLHAENYGVYALLPLASWQETWGDCSIPPRSGRGTQTVCSLESSVDGFRV